MKWWIIKEEDNELYFDLTQTRTLGNSVFHLICIIIPFIISLKWYTDEHKAKVKNKFGYFTSNYMIKKDGSKISISFSVCCAELKVYLSRLAPKCSISFTLNFLVRKFKRWTVFVIAVICSMLIITGNHYICLFLMPQSNSFGTNHIPIEYNKCCLKSLFFPWLAICTYLQLLQLYC